MLSVVAVALGVVVLVALPNLRQGSGILSPGGRRAVRRARQQAKQKPLAAAGGTWHGLVALNRLMFRLGRRIAIAWAPVSAWLHRKLDGLESRHRSGDLEVETVRNVPDIGTPAGQAEAERLQLAERLELMERAGRREKAERVDVPRVTGSIPVGRPRPTPAVSGPIPEITTEQVPLTRSEQAAAGARTGADAGTGADDHVIDLRSDDDRVPVGGGARHSR